MLSEMNKGSLTLFIIAVLSLLIFISCSDDVKKSLISKTIRVEYSDCVGCYDCIEKFDCPQNAIKKDEKNGTVYIDTDRCIGCLDCMNIFHCPEDAITGKNDIIPPAAINPFNAVSDSIEYLNIQFLATGDDSLSGRAYRYDFLVLSGNEIFTDFTPPLPKEAGEIEEWTISGLTGNANVTLKIRAIDEKDNKSPYTIREVAIAGEEIDETPPSQINDLSAISSENIIALSWTAVGDDGLTGKATAYDLRYSLSEITQQNWDQNQQIEISFLPADSGESESLEISHLEIGVAYHFSIVAVDNLNNQSPPSDNVIAEITGDITSPSAINDLMINNVSANSVQLKWTAVGDDGLSGRAESYIIKYAEALIDADNWQSAIEYQNELNPLVSGQLEFMWINGLLEGTEYFFAVKAVDDSNNLSDISNCVNETTLISTDITPPGVIVDLQAISAEAEVILQWTAPGDDEYEGIAAGYEIRMSMNEIDENNWSSAEIIEQNIIPVEVGNHQELIIDQDLIVGQNYYFSIKTYDESDNHSLVSPNAQGSILGDQTSPSPISNLSAEATEQDIFLSWTAPGDDGNLGTASFYHIKISDEQITEANFHTAETLPNPPEPLPAGAEQSYTVIQLEPGIEYFFAIKAYDDFNNQSEISNVVSSQLLTDIIAPSAIVLSVVTGNALNNNTIRLSWIAPGDDGQEGTANHYIVKYSNQPLNEENWENAITVANPPLPATSGSNQFMNVTGLNPGTIYYFAIKAFDEAGNGGELSNSPSGKIVYQIDAGPCNGCGNCVNHCPEDAITDHGSYASINAALCVACGECISWCPRNAIRLTIIAYNNPGTKSSNKANTWMWFK
ncbi:MAG: fibronectin type III domain-containing protein [Candidatus Cloacimonetes bacterium]|nr:fibronectin type III domain-containing protein [Candidatus Cloacimonadota bacterium]